MGEWSRAWKEFVAKNRGIFWISAFSVVFVYGVMAAGLRIGIDSEVNMTDPDYLMLSWYTVSRYTLVWLKELLGMRLLNPFASNLLMMIMLFAAGVGASFLFYVSSGRAEQMRGFCLVFPLLFLTHPCYVQQFSFTLQAFEVAFCLNLCILAVFFVSRFAVRPGKGTLGFLAAGIVCMALGFGGYQALVPVYMAAALASYLIYYEFHENEKRGFYWKTALCHGGAFLGGFVLYQLVGKAVLYFRFGPGFSAGYLDEQLLWKTHDAATCIGFIKSYLRMVVLGEGDFYGIAFLIASLVFALRLLWVWMRKRRREFVFYGAAALALVCSPFFLSFYQGGALMMRTQMTLPFVSAFFCASCLFFAGTAVRWRKFCLEAVAVLLMLTGLRQGVTSSRVAFTAQMVYENDREVARQIIQEMHRLGAADEGRHIAMLGQYRPDPALSWSMRFESIGYSVFEWDYSGPVGVSRRGIGFMNAIGFPYEAATEEEYAMALEAGEEMAVWPSAGSVRLVDDVVVVKFSD